jgi:Fe2+ transport system protein B
MSETYNIDRKTAARLLNVSVRTIDRYLSSGKLASIKNNGRVWVSKADILSLSHRQTFDMTDMTRQHRHVDNIADIDVDTVIHEPEIIVKKQETTRDNTYKELYANAKEELEDKQKQLDQATYRIGQLEAQIETMVPMLEFKKQQQLLAENADQYMKAIQQEEEKRKELARQLIGEIEKKKELITEKEKEIENERLNKSIFAVILFVILCMQPVLWMLLKA